MTLQQLKYAIVIAENKSMNEAAKQLFISQPTLSEAVKSLEKEIGIEIFIRTTKGIIITPQGEEFLGYARQISEQYELMENKYLNQPLKKKFSVSMQHYTFAVKAFVETIQQVGMNEYEFSVRESKTYDVIDNVKNFKSELGVLYLNDFNEKAMTKLFHTNNIIFKELFTCDTYVYLWEKHPLADKKIISMEELQEYPCLSFDQGENNSFFLAEEMKSTYDYKKIIKVDDRATVLNLMKGLNGYTLCSGIISEDLNGTEYVAIPILESEKMRIGYIKRKETKLSQLGEIYINELKKYQTKVL